MMLRCQPFTVLSILAVFVLATLLNYSSEPADIQRNLRVELATPNDVETVGGRSKSIAVDNAPSRHGRRLMLSQFHDPVSTVMKSTADNKAPPQPCVTLECIENSDRSQINWKNIFKGQPTRDLPVPRILHHVVLGENAPPSMLRLVNWNFRQLRANGYETKLWTDAEVEELIYTYGPDVQKMWQYAKVDQSEGRAARLKDIACILILFAEGGVHFDADTVLCNKQVDFMVDKPGVVSFPFQPHNSNQVSPAAMSAPPGHRLMGRAMEFFIRQGPEVGTYGILEATGPHGFARVVDGYIKEVGIRRPPIYKGNSVYSTENPGGNPVPGNVWAAEIADLRFTSGYSHPATGTHHMGFGTWFNFRAPPVRPCDENIDMVYPWLDAFCADPDLSKMEDCFSPL